MKQCIIALLVMMLAGCAGTMPEKADLTIDVANQTAGVYPASLGVTIIGRDHRADPAVILYRVDNEPMVRLLSRVPPQELAKEGLTHGLRRQGLHQDDRSSIAVLIVIKGLLAEVTKPGVLYSSEVRTRLQVVVSNAGSTLTLDYNRQARKDSLTRPKVLDLEMMLNDQLSDIVDKILADHRVRGAIKGRS